MPKPVIRMLEKKGWILRLLKTLHRSCSTALVAILVAALMVCFPQNAVAAELPALASGNVRIHVLPFDDMDAIVVECDGHFGVVDSGEDSLSPDGSDFRYPVRPGTTEGMGKEEQVIAYMKKIGVTQDNLDFYIGTHPHSDHIGSASQIIHEFHPKAIYTPEYDDSLITDYSRLWDNQFVYDRLVEAALWAQEEYGARFIQHLDPNWVEPDPGPKPDPDPDPDPKPDPDPDPNPEPVDPTDPTDPTDPDTGEGSTDGEDNTSGEGAGTTDTNTDDASPASETSTVSTASQSQAAKMTTASFSTTTGATMNSVARTSDTDTGDSSSEDDRTGKPVFKLGSATIEIVNYDEAYLTTKVSDANSFSYGVKVTAANGRTAFLAGDITNKLDADSDGVGDEDRLKATLGKIDFLKMAHHGRLNSNTQDFLNAILKAAQGNDHAVVAQSGNYGLMPKDTITVLNAKGARHFHVADAARWGHEAFVVDLTPSGVKTNVDGDDTTVLQLHGSEPFATMYKDGLPYAVTGWHDGPDGNKYYFGEENSAGSVTPLTNCWATYNGNRVFIGNQGYKALDWQKIDGIWYYFNSDGSLRYGWQQIKGKWYYLDPTSGAMQTGWQDIGSKRYYLDPESGAMATGWRTIDGNSYLFASNGAMNKKDGWLKQDGYWYYGTSSGVFKTGWQKVKGTWYYLDPTDGKMRTGWALVDNTWYFLNDSGAMQKGWLKRGGTWYHLQNSGAMSTGWTKVNGKWYYLDPSNGKMKTGWALVDNTWYFLNDSGAMQKGWLKRGGTWYHLQNSGAMSTGWAKVNGKWYYLDPANGKMKTGWVLVDGRWYRLNSSGAMLTGWQKIGGTWYHLKSSGAMSIGWLEDKGKTYYLTESGAMATGTRTIEGKQYSFSSSGALL